MGVHSIMNIASDLLGNYTLTDGPERGGKYTYTNKEHGKCSKKRMHWNGKSSCNENGECSRCEAPWKSATIKLTKEYGQKRWVMSDGEGRQHFYADADMVLGDKDDAPPKDGWMAYVNSKNDVTTKKNKYAASGVFLKGNVSEATSECPECKGVGTITTTGDGWFDKPETVTCNDCGGNGKFDAERLVNLRWNK